MANHEEPQSYLRKLELEHASKGQLEDVAHSNAISSDQSRLGQSYFMSKELIGCIASIALATTASYWGFSPPAAILTQINKDIGPSDNSSLFSIIWSTSSAVSICLFGRTSDKFGRRWFLIVASIIGFIGGIIACTAQTMNSLIVANIFLGIAGGVHTCYGLLTGEIMPNKYKMVGVVLTIVPAIIPTGFGAYLSLSLVHHTNWRWCYYIYLIMMGPAIALQFFYYKPPGFKQLHGNSRTKMEELRRVDFIGGLLLVSGLTLFLLGISWGGSPLPWTSSRILGLTISGGLTLIAFVLWEIYSNVPNPLMPMNLFKDFRGFVCLNVMAACAGGLYVSLSILWPSQVGYIYSVSEPDWHAIGWLTTTIAFGVWGGIVIVGSFFHIIKNIKWQCSFMMAMAVAFCGALSTANSGKRGQAAAFSFLAALPSGIMELIPAILVQLDADDADLGTVFSIIFTIRSAVGSIMAAVFVAILNNKVPSEIASQVPAAAIAAGLPSSSLEDLFAAITAGTADSLAAVPGITTSIAAAVSQSLSNSYASAYAYVYYAAVAFGLCGLIAALCMKDYDNLLTSHVSRTIGQDRKTPIVSEQERKEGEEASLEGQPDEKTPKRVFEDKEANTE